MANTDQAMQEGRTVDEYIGDIRIWEGHVEAVVNQILGNLSPELRRELVDLLQEEDRINTEVFGASDAQAEGLAKYEGAYRDVTARLGEKGRIYRSLALHLQQ